MITCRKQVQCHELVLFSTWNDGSCGSKMMNHPVMIKTLKKHNSWIYSCKRTQCEWNSFLRHLFSHRGSGSSGSAGCFGFGVVGGWGFQLKFFPTPKNQQSNHFLLFLQHNLLFSQSNGWKLSRTSNASIRWFMLVGNPTKKTFFSKPLITQQICKICKLEDTRRDWNSVVLGHYPGAFVLTAAEIVRTQDGVSTKNVKLTQNSVDFNF